MPENPAIVELASGDIQAVSSNLSADATFRGQMGHISRQSSFFFLGTVFTAATGYVFKVYLARVLGAAALGIYALGMTVVGLLGVFNAFGLPQSAVRFVAAYCATGRTEQLRQFLGRGVFLLLLSNLGIAALLLLAGPWIAVRFYHTPALSKYFGLFALIMVLGVLATFLGQVLAGYQDVLRRTVITNFIGTPLMMLLTVLLIMLGWGLRGYIFAQVASAIAICVLFTISVIRSTPAGGGFFSAMFSPLEKEVASFSALAFAMSLLGFLIAQSDKVLIGFYLNASEVGIYAIASALVAFIPIFLQSVNQIFSPVIADLHTRQEHAMLGRIFQTLTKWSFGLTLPLAAVMIMFAPALMRIFGRDFEIGWPVLVIGAIGELVNCGVGSVGYLLLMAGRQRELLKIQAVMAFVTVILGIVLIRKWGIFGAAVVAASTNLLSNLWCLCEVRVKLGLWPYNPTYLRLLPPSAGMVGVLLVEYRFAFAFHSDWILIGAGLVFGYLVFLGIAIAVGLDSDDSIILRAMWSRTCGRFHLFGAKA